MAAATSALSDNYFNLDDILATQEKVPCVLENVFKGLGYLDQSTTDPDLEANTKMELPFWLVKSFRKHIAPETPKQYREGYRHILSADPNVVDLHRLCPYYYSFGQKLLSLPLPDVEDIGKTLVKTFQGRLRFIMDSSHNALNTDVSDKIDKLDEIERQLFATGQKSLHNFHKWENRETEKLVTSKMVSNLRKRKRISFASQES